MSNALAKLMPKKSSGDSVEKQHIIALRELFVDWIRECKELSLDPSREEQNKEIVDKLKTPELDKLEEVLVVYDSISDTRMLCFLDSDLPFVKFVVNYSNPYGNNKDDLTKSNSITVANKFNCTINFLFSCAPDEDGDLRFSYRAMLPLKDQEVFKSMSKRIAMELNRIPQLIAEYM